MNNESRIIPKISSLLLFLLLFPWGFGPTNSFCAKAKRQKRHDVKFLA